MTSPTSIGLLQFFRSDKDSALNITFIIRFAPITISRIAFLKSAEKSPFSVPLKKSCQMAGNQGILLVSLPIAQSLNGRGRQNKGSRVSKD